MKWPVFVWYGGRRRDATAMMMTACDDDVTAWDMRILSSACACRHIFRCAPFSSPPLPLLLSLSAISHSACFSLPLFAITYLPRILLSCLSLSHIF